ncbi:MAG: AI-2E family transporter [Anaerolineales bacterium]|nr:AI-2E family transporter [Anaerolineales bacterium]
MDEENSTSNSSPAWGTNTKLVVTLTFVFIIGFLLVRFQAFLAPLVLAFMIAYLLHPVTAYLSKKTHLGWQFTVSLIYLLILIILLGLLTLGSVGLVQRTQSLIGLVQTGLETLPELFAQVTQRVYYIGSYPVDLTTLNLDINQVTQELLAAIQPLLSRTGDLVGMIAGGAAQILGLTGFVLIISYFVLTESAGIRQQVFQIEFPGYTEDIRRLGAELGRVWNAFLRGQMIMFTLTVTTYSIVLSVLGVQYAFGIAILTGLARFLPYVGPFITWTVLALVSYFQAFKLFGLLPFQYALLTVGTGIVIDWIFDSLVAPRVMARALKVHPAAIMVTAIIGASLFGIIGLILAAPALATVNLFGRYVLRKMFDLDPWPEEDREGKPKSQITPFLGERIKERVQVWVGKIIKFFGRKK